MMANVSRKIGCIGPVPVCYIGKNIKIDEIIDKSIVLKF